MKKSELVDKIENIILSARDELSKNEGSTLQTLTNSIKSGYESVKASLDNSDKAQKVMGGVKQSMEELAQAVKAGDRKLSAKALDALEKKIREYKEKHAKDQDE